MHWPFAKYVGCGNDFILFDNRQFDFPSDDPTLIQRLCDRHKGIGADGVLLLELSEIADCRMRIFNADGSEAEMCGNGARCFVKWLKTLGFNQAFFRIEAMHRLLQVVVIDNDIQIDMGSPMSIEWDIPFQKDETQLFVHHLDTGVPHTVILIDDLENFPLSEWGPYVRHHPLWMPNGTNLTIVKQMKKNILNIRTYERGVENETLACGTGATAAALAIAYHQLIDGPITVNTRSGEKLIIDFKRNGDQFSHVTMTGPAEAVFRGQIELSTACLANGQAKYSVIL